MTITLAIMQARMTSSRLPGKILKPILGRPIILHEIDRIRCARKIDRLIVATSDDISDDPLASLCRENSVECFRGDLNDVLKRYYDAARTIHPDHVVRLTGDCPLIDPEVIDKVIDFYHDGDYDYATNAVEPTYPDGLDVEVFSYACLERDFKESRLSSEREHVTPWIRKQSVFKIGHFRGTHDWSALRWTVDEPADFELVKMIYEALYPINPGFTTEDVLDLLERRPELKTWNTSHQRNEGLTKSEAHDQERI